MIFLKFSLLGDFARGFHYILELRNDLKITQYNGTLSECDRLPVLYEQWQVLNDKCFALYDYRGLSGGGKIAIESETDTRSESEAYQELQAAFAEWIDDSELIRNLKKIPIYQQLRIAIISDCDTILQLPSWETWNFKSEREAELGFYCSTYTANTAIPQKSSRLRILAVVGGQEIDERGDLDRLQALPNAEIEVLENPKLEKFYEYLCRDWRKNYDIIYFAIHSDKNSVQFAEIQYLQKAIARAAKTRLKLLMFMSCNSPIQTILRIETPIPATIAWEGLLSDEVAHAFVGNFFENYVGGVPFFESVALAKEFLAGFEGKFPRASLAPRIYLCPGQEPPTWEGMRAGTGHFHPRPRSWQRKGLVTGAVSAIATIVLGLGYVFAGETIGREINNWGNEARENRQIDRALFYYRLAGFLWTNGTPQYNIALIYEDVLNNPNIAYNLYEVSARRGDPDALANMTGLLVLHPELGTSETALKLLDFCIDTSKNLEAEFDGAKGSCWIFRGLKNLNSGNLEDAESELLKGVRVIEENNSSPPILGYCGLFKIAAKENNIEEMIKWQNKILINAEYASPIHNNCILEVKSKEI